MIDPTLYWRLAAYNTAMTAKLYDICEEMSDEERKANRGAFFKSVHSTLNHLLMADHVWMGRFTGKAYEYHGIGIDLFDDFPELKTAHLEMAGDIEAWTKTLTPEWLTGDLSWTNIAGTMTTERPRWLLVSHLFNHQTHHRGQITTLLSQAGLDIGVTDLPFVPEFLP